MNYDSGRKGSLAYLVYICLVATIGGLLFGYDTAVISGAIGYLQTHFDLSAAWKGFAASSALIGCVFGAVLAGPLSDRFGRKTALMVAALMFFISAVGTAIPRTLIQFIVFRIVGGVGVGAASMVSPMYIAEVSPARLRGRMVSLNQMAIVSGMLIVYFVNYFISGHGDEAWNVATGWRWMFGSESIPALSLLLLVLFVPESPRWLTEKGRSDEARDVLARVDGDEHAKSEMADIEAALNQESSSLIQLFLPGMRLVLLIGVALAVLQQVTGINVILYYAPEILKNFSESGMNVALLQTVIVGAVNMIFTIIAIYTVDRTGRKPLMLIGAAGMFVSLTAIGVTAAVHAVGVWLLVCMLAYIACFAMSVGPVVWVILSEIFPTKIRGRAMGFATLSLWTANFIVSQTFPMMDENKVLVEKFNHGFPFFVYAGFCVLLFFFMLKMVPETKGKTLEEIEKTWLG